MSTAAGAKTATPEGLDQRVWMRVIEEGYGAGEWHGANLKAALEGVSPALAVWRPAAGRHNIAEIALHHAYTLHAVRAKLSGTQPEAFAAEGEDWFEVAGKGQLTWERVRSVLETEQGRLAALFADLAAGRARSPLPETERFDLALGVTCHAVYHAGQVQLLKRLNAG